MHYVKTVSDGSHRKLENYSLSEVAKLFWYLQGWKLTGYFDSLLSWKTEKYCLKTLIKHVSIYISFLGPCLHIVVWQAIMGSLLAPESRVPKTLTGAWRWARTPGVVGVFYSPSATRGNNEPIPYWKMYLERNKSKIYALLEVFSNSIFKCALSLALRTVLAGDYLPGGVSGTEGHCSPTTNVVV